MPRIKQSSVDRVFAQASVVDVVSSVVQLKRAGRDYKGLSPFSKEKTPSFYVNPHKNVWYCFSTSQGGNAVTFLQQYDKLTFPEAIETLAERFNIPLEYEEGGQGQSRQDRSERREILDIHQYACDYYKKALVAENGEAAAAREYWTGKRGFTLEVAAEHGVGYAPAEGSELVETLIRKGFSHGALAKCGLFFPRESDHDVRRWKLRFRGRLMIPIRDYRGDVVAFTARKMDATPEDDPAFAAKYVNSPNTPTFNKSGIVFGLDVARKALKDSGQGRGAVLLVEGQLDAIRCWSLGIGQAVAPQGTAITDEQLALLKRYSDRIDCLLDGDAAGRRAALRMLPMALQQGFDIQFLPLPDGADPDDLLRENGAAALEDLRKNQLSAMKFAVGQLMAEQEKGPQAKAKALEQIFEILGNCSQATAQAEYLREAVRLLDIDEIAAAADFRRHQRFRRYRQGGTKPQDEGSTKNIETAESRLTSCEHELLLCVFHFPSLSSAIAEVLEHDWIDKDTLHGRVLDRALADLQEGVWNEDEVLVENLAQSEEERNLVFSLLAREPAFEDPVRVANDCLRKLVANHVRRRLPQLQEEIDQLPADAEGLKRFAEIKRKITELRGLRNEAPQLRAMETEA